MKDTKNKLSQKILFKEERQYQNLQRFSATVLLVSRMCRHSLMSPGEHFGPDR